MVTSFSGIGVPVNPEPPEVMHIDLNSAFAMTEQQARPHLRGRPLGVTNRLYRPNSHEELPFSICIAASYEAKQVGIRLGTSWKEAKLIDRSFTMVESNPARYIATHQKLKAILQEYSPNAYMKSIDEGIIDFRGMRSLLKGRRLLDIGAEIKQRIKSDIGDHMTVNVGIGLNNWMAKVAASLNKPDGLDLIDQDNLVDVYRRLSLVDLPYIKRRNKVRLNLANIYTPFEFFQAPYWVLFRQVFNSVAGHHWYLKLRGYETEPREYGMKSAGRNYVLEHRTAEPKELLALLHKASLKISRKLSTSSVAARGMSLRLSYQLDRQMHGSTDRHGWRGTHMWSSPAKREDELYCRAAWLFNQSPEQEVVKAFELSTYGLVPLAAHQESLFDDYHSKRYLIQDTIDTLSERFGEMILAPADVVMSKNPMKDKIPFYSTQYFDITGN